jgi:hypothetical protein
MRSIFFFMLVPAFVLFVLPLMLAEFVGVDTTILLATQLLAVALNHGALALLLRDLVARCRLAHARAGDLLYGLNPNTVAKGRQYEREYVHLALEAAHCANRHPLYLAFSAVGYAGFASAGWLGGHFADDTAARAIIVAASMFASALWLCGSSRRALDALAEMDEGASG